MESETLAMMPPLAVNPEVVYDYPRAVQGLGYKRRRFPKVIQSATVDRVALTNGGGGGVVILFKIPLGGTNEIIDLRDLVFRGYVQLAGTRDLIPTLGLMGGLITELRIRHSEGGMISQTINYDRCYSAMFPFMSTDAVNQIKALDFAGATVATGSAFYAKHAIMSALSSMPNLLPSFMMRGDLLVEIVVVPNAQYVGALSGASTNQVITYTNMELEYSRIVVDSSLALSMSAELLAKDKAWIQTTGFVSSSSQISAGATDIQLNLNHPRVKTILLWMARAPAAVTNHTVNRQSNYVNSYQIYLNDKPLFARPQTLDPGAAINTYTAAADPIREAMSCFKNLSDIYRGFRPTVLEFTADGQIDTNSSQGLVMACDMDPLNLNDVVADNAVRIQDGIRLNLTYGGVGQVATTLYGMYITEERLYIDRSGILRKI